jgi:hypothetical protein
MVISFFYLAVFTAAPSRGIGFMAWYRIAPSERSAILQRFAKTLCFV